MGNGQRHRLEEPKMVADAAKHLELEWHLDHRILVPEYVYGGELQQPGQPGKS